MDLNILPRLAQKQYRDTGVSATELAASTGADRDLIGMRSDHENHC